MTEVNIFFPRVFAQLDHREALWNLEFYCYAKFILIPTKKKLEFENFHDFKRSAKSFVPIFTICQHSILRARYGRRCSNREGEVSAKEVSAKEKIEREREMTNLR